ncbi:transcription antitermination factor NusB [Brevibacterium otitidis]|uniref:Transcription antitermination protein NusB n=1 Tax=Brevibacterium otitidis TaxID=53364 RepID=A0ABV5X3N7_9MICO|nr:hypothetical protein GCM10023233_11420 [Brevibacterium otitidis]
MNSRTRARKRALELLFEAEQRRLPEPELIRMRSGDPDYPMKPYAVEIVSGVVEHRGEIDGLIEEFVTDWPVSRMPAVDRALLRMGIWEIMHNDDVDDPVAIDEAVALGRSYSRDDSPRFINAVLDAVSRKRRTGEAQPPIAAPKASASEVALADAASIQLAESSEVDPGAADSR